MNRPPLRSESHSIERNPLRGVGLEWFVVGLILGHRLGSTSGSGRCFEGSSAISQLPRRPVVVIALLRRIYIVQVVVVVATSKPK